MIVAHSPLRITLGGGGTDLPAYYQVHGGLLVAAAIRSFVTVTVKKAARGVLLRHAEGEKVERARDLKHPIVREALLHLGLEGQGLEIESVSEVPSGTGLGSSGSFATALLLALHALQGKHPSAAELAEEAAVVEIGRVGEPVGKQDPYAAAFGGVRSYRFHPDGTVDAVPLEAPAGFLAELEANTALYFTGIARSAGAVLKEQEKRSRERDPAMEASLHAVKALGARAIEAIGQGDLAALARLMDEQWAEKRARLDTMTNERIDKLYRLGKENGAMGGKLVGAGGGGFLLFISRDHARLSQAMAAEGLRELPVRFDFDGTRLDPAPEAAP